MQLNEYVWIGLVMVSVGIHICVNACNGVCGCNYTGKQGIRSRFTIQLPKTIPIARRVISGCLCKRSKVNYVHT